METSSRTENAAATDLLVSLRAMADPRRAVQEKKYLKSDLEHLGTGVPKMRTVAKAFARASRDASRTVVLDVVRSLWAEPIFEARAISVELLDAYSPVLRASDSRIVERLIRESKTWALVDALAVNIAGSMVERFDELGDTLDAWANDEDFWVRRASMLALLRPLRRGEGDFARFGRYADAMLDEKEFFIRKAIGWILRETSKKQPDLVFEWLLPRASRSSGVTMREALRYLSAPQRARLEEARRG
jgi:3-methyladenine DNA glycosylase AlkD